jgi:cyclopropane fatty-acyl-phospholipid synthase-like methyltransferase
MEASPDPVGHYDRVTEAWGMLLGEELHFGVFDSGDETLPEATQKLTDRMIDSAHLEPGLEVIDIGCGTGTPAIHLAKQFGVRVLGITTSSVGVAAATARAEREGAVQSVRFELRDGTDTGLPSASFDRAWVLESSHLMRDRAGLLNECSRMLRPGGVMSLCDVIRRREIPFEELRERIPEFAMLRDAFGSSQMKPLEEYEQLANGAGLVVESSIDLTTETLPTLEHWRRNAEVNREAVRELIGEEGHETFVRASEILEGMFRDGTMGYGLLSARKPI